jgi:hypothetical protein
MYTKIQKVPSKLSSSLKRKPQAAATAYRANINTHVQSQIGW